MSERIRLLGVEVDNLDMEETLEQVGQFVRSGRPHQHVAVNVDKVVKANADPALARHIAACELINADGMPVVWASRLLGRPLKERVAGIDLFHRLLARAEASGWRVYFLGARGEVLEQVLRRVRREHPRLAIAGARDGYWETAEEPAVVQQIRSAQAQILFVAISSPKKELFLGRHREVLQIPFAMGVGGSFDVYAGRVRRAPRWMQASGLEWFYRFLQEPRRMFRRYFIDDLVFLRLLLREWLLRRPQ